jgi:hypothetical protein
VKTSIDYLGEELTDATIKYQPKTRQQMFTKRTERIAHALPPTNKYHRECRVCYRTFVTPKHVDGPAEESQNNSCGSKSYSLPQIQDINKFDTRAASPRSSIRSSPIINQRVVIAMTISRNSREVK